MNEKIMIKFGREMKLYACLDSIKESCNLASAYINGTYKANDVNELTAALDSVEEYVEDIDNIVAEIAEEYEKEIEELKNEQL